METRKGTTRWVLLIGQYAIKIPAMSSWDMFLYGLLGNMQETKFSSMGIEELAPVVFSVPGGFLNVMPRADVKTFDEIGFEYVDEFHRNIELSEHRDILRNIVESKPCSLGKLNNKIVAVDYGS